jgi:hypothetical protein
MSDDFNLPLFDLNIYKMNKKPRCHSQTEYLFPCYVDDENINGWRKIIYKPCINCNVNVNTLNNICYICDKSVCNECTFLNVDRLKELYCVFYPFYIYRNLTNNKACHVCYKCDYEYKMEHKHYNLIRNYILKFDDDN